MSQLHKLKQFIIDELIPNGHAQEISDDLDLISNGIIDSLGVLKLVAYIEDQFDLALDPDEIDPENFDSIASISNFISGKISVAEPS